jgi:hypothetical protein
MHSQDIINQVIDLRAEGKSCRTIAAALNISLGAAHKLSQEHDDEIQQLAFARREALRERYLTNFEGKLSDLAAELQRIDEELKLRDFATVSTEFLLYRKTCLQARQEKLAQEPAPKPLPPIAVNKNEHS